MVAVRAEPVTLWDDHECWAQAGGVPPCLTGVTEQDPLRMIPLSYIFTLLNHNPFRNYGIAQHVFPFLQHIVSYLVISIQVLHQHVWGGMGIIKEIAPPPPLPNTLM